MADANAFRRQTLRGLTDVDDSWSPRVASALGRGACFGWTVSADTEITGPISQRLFVETEGICDVDLFVVVEKH